MKTQQHTPGPWLTIADRNEIIIYANSGPHGDDPICFTSDSRPVEEIQANARLITSAPELLEALTSLYEAFPKGGANDNQSAKAVIQAKAVISKAIGQ